MRKMARIQGGFEGFLLSAGLQPPGLFFKEIAGSTEDLQIIFLEPSDKMSADIMLTVYHNRSLYLLFSLYQNIFSVVLEELLHGFVKHISA